MTRCITSEHLNSIINSLHDISMRVELLKAAPEIKRSITSKSTAATLEEVIRYAGKQANILYQRASVHNATGLKT